MDISFDDVEKYLVDIFSGCVYTRVGDLSLVFRFPTNKIKQMAYLMYQKSFDEAIKNGLLPLKELEELIEKRNLITTEEILKLTKLKSQLEAQQILLGKTTIVKANQDRIKQVIHRLKTEISQIEYKRRSKLLMSAETKAEEDKTMFICSQCVFDENDNLYWSSYKEALKEDRLILKDEILFSYLRFYAGLSTSIIRAIARNNLWRVRYITSTKASDSLFGIPTSDYTTDQLNLVYWSNYYQSIYEMLPEDRPSDIVIEDDDTLDAYMKTIYEERNKDDAARKSKTKRSGKLSAFDSDEVIITRSHELYQDIAYDTPREAQKLKDRVDIKKKAKKGLGK